MSTRIVAIALVAACSPTPPSAPPRSTPPVVLAPAPTVEAPQAPTTTLTTIAGPGKRILIHLAGFDASFRLVYVLQSDGTLVAWKPPHDTAPDWYTLRREIATHVTDFDGYEAIYEDGTTGEMRTSGRLIATSGTPHAVSIDQRLGGFKCAVDATDALLCARSIRDALKPTGITHARLVRAGRDEACALVDGGDLACFGADAKITVRAHDVVAFAVDFGVGCAVTSAGDVGCWGGAPSFTVHDAIGVSLDHSAGCVLRRSSAPLCWGAPFPTTPTEIDWLRGAREVAIRKDLVCALYADRSACHVE